MINDKFPLSIGEEMVRNERTLLSKVENGKMMMSADSVRFLVLHCSATRRNQDYQSQQRYQSPSTSYIRQIRNNSTAITWDNTGHLQKRVDSIAQ